MITTHSYDGLYRLTQVSYNTVSGVTTAPTVSYTYDTDSTYSELGDGMLLRVNVGSDYQERYTVDDTTFRITSTIRSIGTRTYTTGYSYNQADQLKQLSYPSGRAIDIGYDSAGRLTSLVSPPSNGNVTYLSSMSYNVAGQVTGDTLGNGVTEVFGYDANRMQLTSQKAGTTSPYTDRVNLTYGFAATSGQMGSGSTAGNAGQLMSVSGTIDGATESAAYTYDNLGRLVTSNQTSNAWSAQRRFAYDRWGNRTGVWDAISGGNQIQSISLAGSGGIPNNQIASVTTIGTVTNSYDAAGNVTSDGAHTYSYDSQNRLVSVDSGSTATYAYDHQNRRYKRTVGSAITHYVWDGAKVLAEHNGSTGSVLSDYIFSGGRIIGRSASGTHLYFVSNWLSVRMALGGSGNIAGRTNHLPFGEDFAQSGTIDKHRFSSYERDSESNTDYAINRQYATTVGKFMRPDPKPGDVSMPQSLNRFSYVLNDPVNLNDPLGLVCQDFIHLVYWDDPGAGIIIDTDATYEYSVCTPDSGRGGGDPWPADGDPAGEPQTPVDPNQQLVFDIAFEAGERLDKLECRNYLGGSRISQADLKKKFQEMSARGQIRATTDQAEVGYDSQGVPAVASTELGTSVNSTVIRLGPVFLQGGNVGGANLYFPKSVPGTKVTRLAQQLIMLHELGHAAGSPNAPHSRAAGKMMDNYNKDILWHCFGIKSP